MIQSSLRPDGHGPTRSKPKVQILEIKRPASLEEGPRTEWVLIERKEELESDSTTLQVHRAKISIFYWLLNTYGEDSDVPTGEFSGCYDSGFNAASITASCLSTGGYVVVDPPKLRGGYLGTYLMNEIVMWVKRWPDAEVRHVTLLGGNSGPENRKRRNRFYESIGMEFDYDDETNSTGISRPIRAGKLNEVTSWTQTITEHDPVGFLRTAVTASERMERTAKTQSKSMAEMHKVLCFAERHPTTWITRMWIKHQLPFFAAA